METTQTKKYTIKINLYITTDVSPDILTDTGHAILNYAILDQAINELFPNGLPDNAQLNLRADDDYPIWLAS